MLIDLEFFFEVFFDLTLFFLLLLILYRLYVQYLFPFLYEQISNIKKRQIDIKNKIKLLDASKFRLDGLIESQQHQCNLLDEKVGVWHKFIEQKNRKETKDRHDLIEKIKEKRARQQELFCLFKLEKNAIVPSISQVYNTLGPIRIKSRGRELLTELVDRISTPCIGEK